MATLESIQRELGVSNAQLDVVITEYEHFDTIAESLSGSSNTILQSAFQLTEQQKTNIHKQSMLENQKTANLKLLEYWREKYLNKATYRALMAAVLKFTRDAILARKICAFCAKMPGAKMSGFGTTTIEDLKTRTGVKDNQLGQTVSDPHLRSIAQHIENWPQYAEELQLRRHQQEDIRLDIGLNYLMKIRRTLQVWKSNTPFDATYKRLIEAALALGDGQVAVEICTLCKGTVVEQSPASFPSFTAWLESKGVSKKDIDKLTSEGFETIQGFKIIEPEDLDELGITKAGKKLIPKLLQELQGPGNDPPQSSPAAPVATASPVPAVGVVSSTSQAGQRSQGQQQLPSNFIDYSKIDCSKFAYTLLVKTSVKLNSAMSKDPSTLAQSLFSKGFIAQSTLDEVSELNETKTHKGSRLYSAVLSRVKSFPNKFVDFMDILRANRLMYGEILKEIDSLYETMK